MDGQLKVSGLTLLLLLQTTPLLAAGNSSIRQGLDMLSGKVSVEVVCNERAGAFSRKFFNDGADCTEFIKPNGLPGPLGNVIIKHIQSMGSKGLFFNKDLPGPKKICPGWSQMTKEEMAYFWTWFIAAISWKETTCGVNTTNKAATHGVAVGHLQLNQNVKDRSWRGGESGKSCAVADVSNDANNLKCGLEILNEQLKGKAGLYKGNGDLFGKGANSYWQALRTPSGDKVIEYMKDFPFCK